MAEDDTDILEERPESVKTGRTVDEIAGEAPGRASKTGKIAPPRPKAAPAKLKGAVKATMPDFVPPMLAALVPKPPTGKKWLHEIKLDGYRLQAHIAKGKVKLITRGGLRSEEHTSELQSILRTPYALFCLKTKKVKRNSNNE